MKRLLMLAALVPPLALMAQPANPLRIGLNNWATGLHSPLSVTNCGDHRLFVVQQAGTIVIVTDSMQVLPTPFLDITTRVNSTGNEQGLLGLAFDPGYAANGYFYVYYIFGSGAGTSRISRFQVSAGDPDLADPGSEVVLYTRAQPYSNHNGGCLRFGPDGYLYCGFGDGGSGNDPGNNGQTLSNVLGDMIRIDVSQHDDTYLVPPDNPWVETQDTLPEIWASGLRNPWRFSFDRLTGDLWIGDVGQNAWEEIDFWPAGDNSGPNFGWRCREGFVATPGVSQAGCQPAAAYVAPVAVFDHGAQGWCSVIGGYVYRGTRYPHLYGQYIFTDYCAGDFLTFGAGHDVDTLLMTTTLGYAGFGEGADGELYVANVENGQLKKIRDACPMEPPTVSYDGAVLSSTDANAYQWYMNGTLVPGATQQEYAPTTNGVYAVVADLGAPCTLASEPFAVMNTAVADHLAGRLQVFPQPAQNVLFVQRGDLVGRMTVGLLDATGRLLRTIAWPSGVPTLEIGIADLANGSYVLRTLEGQRSPLIAPVLVTR